MDRLFNLEKEKEYPSPFSPDFIKVRSLIVTLDPHLAIQETIDRVEYRGQKLFCRAEIDLTGPYCRSVGDSHWSIGLIQACTYVKYDSAEYKNRGSVKWESHPLVIDRATALNDSIETNALPFIKSTARYDLETSRTVTNGETINLFYDDHGDHRHATWAHPFLDDSQLTEIKHDKEYTVWLVAFQHDPCNIHVLKTFKWHHHIYLNIDCNKPLGQRVKASTSEYNILDKPQILSEAETIPMTVFHEPLYRYSQSLIWYPHFVVEGEAYYPQMLKAPRQIIKQPQQWWEDLTFCWQKANRFKFPNPDRREFVRSKVISKTPCADEKTGIIWSRDPTEPVFDPLYVENPAKKIAFIESS